MFNFINPTDTEQIKIINTLIYGEAGSGKTSLASTAKNPILFDFDRGAHRSQFRKTRVSISNWKKDIIDNRTTIEEQLKSFDTIIIDTVETALEFLGAYIIQADSKYSMPKYQLQFYGRLKDEFASFINILNSLQKDVIMVCHVKEKDEGDIRIKRPHITGGTYDKILRIADFVGYQAIVNGQRTINFNPTEFHTGKNSADFDILKIPDFKEQGDYLEKLIIEMKNSMSKMSVEQAESLNKLDEIQLKIDSIEKIEELQEYMSSFAEEKAYMKKQIWSKIKNRAELLGYEYHQAEKSFIKTEDGNAENINDDA